MIAAETAERWLYCPTIPDDGDTLRQQRESLKGGGRLFQGVLGFFFKRQEYAGVLWTWEAG